MKANRRLIIRPFLVAGIMLGGGCTHVYKMKLEAAARPDASNHISYSVRDLSSASTSNSTVADASRNYVRTALSAKGMYESPAGEEADLDVAFVYRVDGHPRTRVERRAIYRTENDGMVMMDNVEYSTTEMVYEKALHVVATEKKSANPETPRRVWDVSISYDDSDSNLAKAMPLLAAAATDHIGDNTEGPITIRLRDKDEVVAFIKRGL